MRTQLLCGNLFALLGRRFLIVAITLPMLVLSRPVLAQSQPLGAHHVTVKVEDASLDEVMQILRRQVKLQFIIDAGASDKAQHIRLDMTDAPLSGVLGKILSGKGLEYVINKNVVIIRKISTAKLQDTVVKAPPVQVTVIVKSEDGTTLGGASVSDASDNYKTAISD